MTRADLDAERVLFEIAFPIPKNCYRGVSMGMKNFYESRFNIWECDHYNLRWEGWQAALASQAPAVQQEPKHHDGCPLSHVPKEFSSCGCFHAAPSPQGDVETALSIAVAALREVKFCCVVPSRQATRSIAESALVAIDAARKVGES